MPGGVSPVPELKIETIEDYQTVAARIATRVREDDKFAQQIRDDPVFTLRTMGLQQDVVRELMSEDRYLRTRYASALEDDDCNVTCIITCKGECCFTCWLTDWVYGETRARQVIGAADADSAIPVSPEKARLAQTLWERGHLHTPVESEPAVEKRREKK
jgi:hypothetical protein